MAPTQEQIDEVMLSCRYGELDEVKAFVEEYGKESVDSIKDDRGNTALHMVCGNGHLEVLEYLLPFVSAPLLSQVNDNGSPPLHWAILNNHTQVVKALVDVPEEKGGGIQLLKQKNRAGRPAFSEAVFAGEGKEEVAGWIEGYLWRAEGGDDEEEGEAEGKESKAVEGEGEEIKVSAGDETSKEESEAVDEIVDKTQEVDIAKA